MRTYGQFEIKNDNQLWVLYPDFEPNLEEYKDYLFRLENNLNKTSVPVEVIYDTSKSKYLSSENRALQSKWIKEKENLLKEKVAKMVFIIPSIAVRLVLKTILTFSPLPCPYDVVKSYE